MTIVVIYKQPPEGEKLNVKRFIGVDPATVNFFDVPGYMVIWEVPIELAKIAEIKIIP